MRDFAWAPKQRLLNDGSILTVRQEFGNRGTYLGLPGICQCGVGNLMISYVVRRALRVGSL